jgi:hypothetical protein
MVTTSKGRLAAAELPSGDALRILLDQHARIGDLIGQVRRATGKRRRDAFAELRRLLAVHEAAEEMIMRPVTRTASGGNRIASARNHEEHMATHLLADLEKMDLSSQEFTQAFDEFATKVLQHAEHEEAEEFPLILRSRGGQQRAWLGRGLRAVETLAPTHPHPTAAGSTAAQYILGPFASLADHARDAMGHRA